MGTQTSANLFLLSAIPQDDYNTLLAPSDVTKVHRQIDKDNINYAKYSVITNDNRGHSTGTPHPTRKNIESHDVSIQLSEDCSSQLLGERAKAGFGKVTTSIITANETFQHLFEMLNPHESSQLPAYDYAEKAGESASKPNAHSVRYPSLVCGNWSCKGEGKSILQLSTQWMGSGKRIPPAPHDFFGAGSEVILLKDMVHNYFRNTAATVNLYPEKELGGSAFTLGCDFRDLEVSINNNLAADDGYQGCAKFQDDADPESGAVRGKLEIGTPSVQLSFTMIQNDGYDAYDKMQKMASISASFKYEGKVIESNNKHFAEFLLNHGNISDIDHTPVEGKNGLRITTEPLALGQVMPISLLVQNDVSSYATANW